MPETLEIVLSGPNGEGETTVSTTTAFNNLVYGGGFTPRDMTVEDAYAALLAAAQGEG